MAQNDQDLAAERGLSSFDQRHRFAADFTWRAAVRRATALGAATGLAAALLGRLGAGTATSQLASGTPFTARVLGERSDVAAA